MSRRAPSVTAAVLAAVVGLAAPNPGFTAPASPSSAAAEQQQPARDERIVEVRFHGNYSIPDDELLELTGIEIGDALTDALVVEVERRLRDSGRFEWVEIRRRYRSLERTDQVVLIVAVREQVSTTEKMMFLPILTWTDEYGITYGGRVTFIDLFGAGERLSVPMSWGGEKQLALEVGRAFEGGPIHGVAGGFGLLSRENPHFEVDDQRTQAWGGVYRRLGPVRADASLEWANVDFGDNGQPILTYGLGARIDTRQEASLPRDAFYAGFDWHRLNVLDGGPEFDRVRIDLRGFKGFFGRTIVAVQALYEGADGRLPDYERPFLGGAATLRGFDAGEFIGDNRAIASVEWRVPVVPPVPVGQAGVSVFFDTGTVYDHSVALSDARFHHGVGAGAFLFATVVGLKIDVAWDLEDSVRVHFSTGFRF